MNWTVPALDAWKMEEHDNEHLSTCGVTITNTWAWGHMNSNQTDVMNFKADTSEQNKTGPRKKQSSKGVHVRETIPISQEQRMW